MLALFSLLSIAILVGVDYITKLYFADVLGINSGKSIVIIDKIFELNCISNTGVSWGMLKGQRWLFIPVSLLVTVIMLVILFRSPLNRYKTFVITCVLIAAGGIGNLIDRIAYGYVIDFLYFKLINFPIFNFADCCVSVGAVLLFVFVLFIYKEKEELPLRTLLFGIQKKVNPHDGE